MEFQLIYRPKRYSGERKSFKVNIPFYSNLMDQFDLTVNNVKCPFTLVLNDRLSIPPSTMFKETQVVTLCPLISSSHRTVFEETQVVTPCPLITPFSSISLFTREESVVTRSSPAPHSASLIILLLTMLPLILLEPFMCTGKEADWTLVRKKERSGLVMSVDMQGGLKILLKKFTPQSEETEESEIVTSHPPLSLRLHCILISLKRVR